MRKRKMLLAFLLFFVLTSCADKDLQQAASTINKILQSTKTLQDTVIAANAQQLMTDDETRPVIILTKKIAQASLQANSVVENLSKLDPNSKVNLYQIIHPIAESMDINLITQLTSIKNEDKKQAVYLLLITIQTSLRTLDAAFGGGK